MKKFNPATRISLKQTFFLMAFLTLGKFLFAINNLNYVTSETSKDNFPIFTPGSSSTICLSPGEFDGIITAAKNLQGDIEKVSGAKPEMKISSNPQTKQVIIIGSTGKSELISKLIEEKKIDVSQISGKWESYITTVVTNPFKGVDKALVIAGSDMRGTIYGIYSLSEQIGVSPWCWWADVPVLKQKSLSVIPGVYSPGGPKVKYRGIFINDEDPALSGWVQEKFGGFNHKFYEHVFELILRLKGNYLWPAMWGKAFYDDDSLNAVVADKYGVVIGTSHHEPMMRAHVEWARYGNGPWNYEKNEKTLQDFWRTGIERMDDNESIVTVGMRGDGDEPMTKGTAIALLEKIVADQRKIIEGVTGKPASETPQDWALYKEVQDYYDKGMRVPDDITLLLCDDNWGNVRILPKKQDLSRKGGFGMYYHFDFVGGPRNYKWLNTVQIERVWEQMHLTYKYGVDRIWLVNVGDIKPLEFPISFFFDYAWNPDSINARDLPDYYTNWSRQQFGPKYAKEAGEIIAAYTKYNARRKPEMLSTETYSLQNYREAENVVDDYNRLAVKADKIYQNISPEYKDAFYQLVEFPVEICANLNNLYFAAAKNHLFAKQGRTSTDKWGERAKMLFIEDSVLTTEYHSIGNGRWNHIMSQTHIGYTNWQQPDKNNMPVISRISVPDSAKLGIAIENDSNWYPVCKKNLSLPAFDNLNNQQYYIELFNRGKIPVGYNIRTKNKWITISDSAGKLSNDKRVLVTVDWDKVPKGKQKGNIIINGSDNSEVSIAVPVKKLPASAKGFIENNGVIAIEAADFTTQIPIGSIHWQVVPNLGKTSSAVTPVPVTVPFVSPGLYSPRLEYKIFTYDTGEVSVTACISPLLNFKKGAGLKFAVSVDNQEPKIVNVNEGEEIPDWEYPQWWNQAVSDNIQRFTVKFQLSNPGEHVVKYYMVDTGVVLQRIELGFPGTYKNSYLGAPESLYLR